MVCLQQVGRPRSLTTIHCCRAVLIVNELRSDSVQSVFMQIFGEHYSIKRIAASKLHPLYQHPAIQVFQLKLRRQGSSKGTDGVETAPCPGQP